MGNISIWQLLIVLLIVLVLFGSKRLRNLGGDLGSAIRGFRKELREKDKEHSSSAKDTDGDQPPSP